MEKSRTEQGKWPRSYLYVPGDRADRLQKALDRGADAIIVDLEDAVATVNKAPARDFVSRWLKEQEIHLPAIWVRISAKTPEEDIQCISAPVGGVMVAQSETPLLAEVDQLLAKREAKLGLPVGRIGVIPLIETARGLLTALDLALAPRTIRLAIGRADLAGELGLTIDPEGVEFRSLLLPLVIASSAAGIAAPVAPTSTDFKDLDTLKATTEQLLALGFRGRTAVHPSQIETINTVFSPSAEEVSQAMRLVLAFERAKARGSGVTTDEHGRMVDAAVVRSARDILARAK